MNRIIIYTLVVMLTASTGLFVHMIDRTEKIQDHAIEMESSARLAWGMLDKAEGR